MQMQLFHALLNDAFNFLKETKANNDPKTNPLLNYSSEIGGAFRIFVACDLKLSYFCFTFQIISSLVTKSLIQTLIGTRYLIERIQHLQCEHEIPTQEFFIYFEDVNSTVQCYKEKGVWKREIIPIRYYLFPGFIKRDNDVLYGSIVIPIKIIIDGNSEYKTIHGSCALMSIWCLRQVSDHIGQCMDWAKDQGFDCANSFGIVDEMENEVIKEETAKIYEFFTPNVTIILMQGDFGEFVL
jgi:hypothetical protein